jgi:hypothetical protein
MARDERVNDGDGDRIDDLGGVSRPSRRPAWIETFSEGELREKPMTKRIRGTAKP